MGIESFCSADAYEPFWVSGGMGGREVSARRRLPPVSALRDGGEAARSGMVAGRPAGVGERDPPVPVLTSGGARGAAERPRRACGSTGTERPRAGRRGRAVAGSSPVPAWARCPRGRVAERELACLVCGASVREALGGGGELVRRACLRDWRAVPESPEQPLSAAFGRSSALLRAVRVIITVTAAVLLKGGVLSGEGGQRQAFCRLAAVSHVCIAIFLLFLNEEW